MVPKQLSYKSNKDLTPNFEKQQELIFENLDDPRVSVIIHKQKRDILKLLIDNELNIKEIQDLTKINPGTIKRHLDDLVLNNLVIQTQTIKNEFGFVLKYYRAVYKKFTFNVEWP